MGNLEHGPGGPLADNAKTGFAKFKVNLWLCPPVALVRMAHAMLDGELKYGAYAFRTTKVSAAEYIAAVLRHVELWATGEENATDSKAHHLGHAMACLAILLDAQAHGNLIDDRRKSEGLVRVLEETMQAIKERIK